MWIRQKAALWALVACAVTCSTASAQTRCGDWCKTIQTIINARSSRFAPFKTDMYVKDYAWHSNLAIPGLTCSVTDDNSNANRDNRPYSQFECDTVQPTDKKAAAAVFRRLIDAVRAAEPDWVWYKEDNNWSTPLSNGKTFTAIAMPGDIDLETGPSKDNFWIALSYSEFLGAKLTVDSMGYEVRSFVHLEPYTFGNNGQAHNAPAGRTSAEAAPVQLAGFTLAYKICSGDPQKCTNVWLDKSSVRPAQGPVRNDDWTPAPVPSTLLEFDREVTSAPGEVPVRYDGKGPSSKNPAVDCATGNEYWWWDYPPPSAPPGSAPAWNNAGPRNALDTKSEPYSRLFKMICGG